MKPYILSLSIYADGYSHAVIKCEQGELKTERTESGLAADNENYGIDKQLQLVMAVAKAFLDNFKS